MTFPREGKLPQAIFCLKRCYGNPFPHFAKTTDFLLKFSVLRAGVLQ